MGALGMARGVTMGIFFLITTSLVSAFLFVPLYMLKNVNRSAHRRFVAFVMGAFWTVSVYWLEKLNGVKFKFYGKELGRSTDTSSVIVCNHPTEFDMPFFWHIPYRLGLVGNVKFVTKAAVRRVPFLGWGINMAEYLFLQRNWVADQLHIKAFFSSFAREDNMVWVLFPEGTDMEAYKVVEHQKYQKENGIPILSRVLTPKHRGLHAIISALRVTHPHTVLYDYTMTYVPIPKSAATIVSGKGPKECHIHVRRFTLGELPGDDTGMKKWCIDAYVEKDRQLQYIAENGQFNDDCIDTPLGFRDFLKALGYFMGFIFVDVVLGTLLYSSVTAQLWFFGALSGLQLWVVKPEKVRPDAVAVGVMAIAWLGTHLLPGSSIEN